MTDDIVERLRSEQHYSKPNAESCICTVCLAITDAIREIERLRRALVLACDELSFVGPDDYSCLDDLIEHFMQEARRG